ncbi:hypothetical protein JHN63_51245 [Streptomyces sp. MBT65]|uniref:hypothetical protein n=1 Tax=Streptomyces sp. MBT65 TaxID=1488395 RepID=UPI00190BCCFD|nr:hypothetical protein [Streptomyces sp. MBT65]MBK3581979.1 hypothetical protein [Streptomyces sp. MBT65]
MPRSAKKPRRLVADGRTYLWSLRHSHRHRPHRHPDSVTDPSGDGGRAVGCVHTLSLRPQPTGSGGALHIVFVAGPGRYVPGGAPLGSGDVGHVHGASLNLHEPGAVRALLDAALERGWLPRAGASRDVEVDGWALLEAAAGARAAGGPGPRRP